MKKLSPYAKAAAGFLASALVALLGAQDGGVTGQEWLQVALAGLAGSGLVYLVPNRDPRGLHQAESVQPPERGEGLVDILLVVVIIVVLVWVIAALFGHR